ncbi:sulfurtransferase complex subunit TusC [Ketobacter sp. MCCC 1A13808]|uniref:sulfurtransferase complex subunit TusC n=1 Tax=Ketobacter sp. MCCC 1A13808 TaxID=2602738 RepID=UPI000F273872|nr:sulfurtransferase complex subunit TusC [Ketobacter sp. MCCC 1A13808]MVF10575.1 sulfurtransferase complex subunit TusC [Ketobacter sp. MCCC 1A13808]RLP56001.1 MAG: sulfurtransferase complex subunit TusC [Ketobacter sp.]
MRSTLIINQKAPHAGMGTREALDAALATAAFGVKTGVLFLDDGIFQIIKNQNTDPAGQKNTAAIFKSFALYDIDHIFVRAKDLALRGLTEEDLSVEVQLVEDDAVSDLFCQFDNLLTF